MNLERKRIERIQQKVDGYSDQHFKYIEANHAYNKQVAGMSDYFTEGFVDNSGRDQSDDNIVYLSDWR